MKITIDTGSTNITNIFVKATFYYVLITSIVLILLCVGITFYQYEIVMSGESGALIVCANGDLTCNVWHSLKSVITGEQEHFGIHYVW